MRTETKLTEEIPPSKASKSILKHLFQFIQVHHRDLAAQFPEIRASSTSAWPSQRYP